MGHELAGTVAEVGAGVTGFQVGDPVAVMSYVACGVCEQCRMGDELFCRSLKMVGFDDTAGGYAELIRIRAGSVFKLAPGLDFRAAATIEPLVVGLHGIRRAALQAGENCLVIGAGPIGLITVAWARLAGARAIIVSEPSPARRKIATRMGADEAVDPRFNNPLGTLSRIASSGPDVVFDCAGSAGSLAEAITYARRGGRVVALGASLQDDGISPATAMSKELDLRFSLGLEKHEVETAIAMLAAGRITTDPIITHVVGLEDFPRAFASLPRAVDQVKVMLNCE
jgi:2-desacetyl-2-hydroxyethyl bacteriochlorophyllide A dehydrogenase